jgi:hypothetical protein
MSHKSCAGNQLKPKTNASASQVLESFQTVILAYTDYQKIAEQEATKRQAIQAWESAQLAKIQERRDMVLHYLDASFDERAANFRELFALADQAIKLDNNDMLATTLNSLVEVAKTNPFDNLADANIFQDLLDNPEHIWEF